MNVYAVIVAGGRGTRFGGDLPKQFAMLASKPVLLHTLEAFRKVVPMENIVTVIGEGMEEIWRQMCVLHGADPGNLATGGSTRWESVRNGIHSLNLCPEDIVLVHDAARPLVNESIINNVISAVENGFSGAIPVTAVTDSIRLLHPDGSSAALERELLRAVQTPQAFRAAKLLKAFKLPYSPLFTDEASMMEASGFTDLILVEGSPDNFKITHSNDLIRAEDILRQHARRERV